MYPIKMWLSKINLGGIVLKLVDECKKNRTIETRVIEKKKKFKLIP